MTKNQIHNLIPFINLVKIIKFPQLNFRAPSPYLPNEPQMYFDQHTTTQQN